MSRVYYNYVQLPKCTNENIKDYVRECKKMYSTDTRKTHHRVTIPTEWPSEFEKYVWEREQIEKCIKGTDDMCGKMYFYFNFCLIQNITGGTIKPQYRNADSVWFQLIEMLSPGKKFEGYGMVCVKRRRCGASWKEACDAVHDALFNHSYYVGMDSKTEKDSFALLSKIKFIYDNLPSFLRIPLHGGKSRSVLTFARRETDENGTAILKGNMSTIFVVAPTDSAYEGSMLSKWISDEAGKKPNLLTMWGLTIPCMMQEEKRFGIPVIFGTAGDIDKGSSGLEELWFKRDSYKLKPFFVPGWMGLMVDKYGNDDIYGAVKHILQTRKSKFDSGAADYFDYVQQFPLTIEEALLRKDQRGIGNTLKIDAQIEELVNNPSMVTYGYMEEYNGESVFRPATENSPLAIIKVYEKPNKHWENAYVSGCLPPGEMVLTDEGFLPIEEIGKEYKLVSKDGDYVEIKETQKHYTEEPLYKFKVSNTFRRTRFTGEHPLYVSENIKGYNGIKSRRNGARYSYQKFDFGFKKASEVKEKEWIKYPNVYKRKKDIDLGLWDNSSHRIDRLIKNPLNEPDFWWFIGLWIGDGHLSKHYSNNRRSLFCEKISISCNAEEKETISRIASICQRLFNRKPYIRTRNNRMVVEVTIAFKQLAFFIEEHFGSGCLNKRIPEWVKFMDYELKKSLVSGYIDSDGSFSKNKETDYNAEIVSINLSLIEGFQDILFSLGIISSTSLLRRTKKEFIQERLCTQKETYRIRMGNHAVWKMKKYGFSSVKLNMLENVRYTRDNKMGCFFSDDLEYIYFQIQGIEQESYKGFVYNFHCETSTYICRSIATHNCDPADHDHVQNGSDLSIFILGRAKGSLKPRVVACMTYRPDRVEEFYEQAFMLLEWYNNTKVLIEKNRNGMIKYAKYFGHAHLLRREPVPPTKNKHRNRKADIGIIKTTATGLEMERCINEFTTEYCDQIPDLDLLRNMKKYGTVNVDDVIAFGWACVALEDDMNIQVEESRADKNLFNFGFKKINGRIVRYNQ